MLRIVGLSTALLFASVGSLFAQATSTISGRVVDQFQLQFGTRFTF